MIALVNPSTGKPVHVADGDVDGFLAVGFVLSFTEAEVAAAKSPVVKPARSRSKKSS